jgi:catechol-2,3-dioxygenase
MVPVRRLNHAVLYVRDVERSARFYRDVLGMEEVSSEFGGRALFLRGVGSPNHHDLGLFTVGDDAPSPPPGSVGLYHLAWEVASIRDLSEVRAALAQAGALTGESDHGATKSLYARDPDGIELEVLWMVPREQWGEYERAAVVKPLDLEAEVARHG